MTEMGDKCDHDPCHCATRAGEAVTEGKTIFCSTGCAQGRGCDHADCDCGSQPSIQPR